MYGAANTLLLGNKNKLILCREIIVLFFRDSKKKKINTPCAESVGFLRVKPSGK